MVSDGEATHTFVHVFRGFRDGGGLTQAFACPSCKYPMRRTHGTPIRLLVSKQEEVKLCGGTDAGDVGGT